MFTILTFLVSAATLALLILREVFVGLDYAAAKTVSGVLDALAVPLVCIFFLAIGLRLLLPLE